MQQNDSLLSPMAKVQVVAAQTPGLGVVVLLVRARSLIRGALS